MARKMKDSGIEWIGEIPEGWETIKLLFALDRPITDGPHETPSYTEEGVPFITINNIDDNGNIDKEKANKISKIDAINYNKKAKMKIGDLLFSKSATIGRVSEVDKVDFMVWSPFAIISTKDNFLYNKYLKFILSLPGYIDHLIGLGSVNTQINIGMRDMEKSIIPLPNLKKQILISSYLDKKTKQIENIKNTINEEIENLENYKKSVITEAITKGLDKNVEMKDSGIEWIGEIPKDWKVTKLKVGLSEKMKYGANEQGVEFSEELPRYIRITDIADNNTLKDQGKFSLTEEKSIGYILHDNTVLFARSGATVGKTFYYKANYGRAAFAGYLISATTNDKILLGKWLYYFTLTHSYDNWISQIYSQSTIQNISAEKYSNMKLPISNVENQKKIVMYLDNKCRRIDDSISIKQKQLETLEEYKKSLIYEYVTGKKEVELG